MTDDAGLRAEVEEGGEFAEQTGALLQRLINAGALEEKFGVTSFAQAVPIARALREHCYGECGVFDESLAGDRQSKFELYLA